MKLTLSLVFLIFSIARVLGDPSTSVVVFLPEGAKAVLSNHEDFEPYIRHLTLDSGEEHIVIPRLSPSNGFIQTPRDALMDPQAWSSIETRKTEITTLRSHEAYALEGSAGRSPGAVALWLLLPDTQSLVEGLRGAE